MNYYNEPWQIISDGKFLYVVTEKGSLKIVNPIMKAYNLSIDRPIINVDNHFVSGLQSFDLSFDITGQSFEWLADSKNILLNFFQSASIQDLLMEINKKIEERN